MVQLTRPIVVLPAVGLSGWLVTGYIVFGTPLFVAWVLGSGGLAVMAWHSWRAFAAAKA